jgi:hypothetical protein
VTAQLKTGAYLSILTRHPDDLLSYRQGMSSRQQRERMGGLGQASAFRSTEVEEGREGQSRRNAKAASEAASVPVVVGMEAGKGTDAA